MKPHSTRTGGPGPRPGRGGQSRTTPGPKRGPAKSSTGASPRDLATWAISRQVARFPDLDPAPLQVGSLGGRDANFAHAIYDAVLRRWRTLEYLLNAQLRQPLNGMKPGAQAVLLTGAAQILFLDRVPVHAAIDEAVEWAKVHLSGSLAGMTNGVLRNVWRAMLTRSRDPEPAELVRRPAWTDTRHEILLDDGSALLLKEALLPEDSWERLAMLVSCPTSLLAHWRTTLGDAEARRQALHLLTPPPTVVTVSAAKGVLPDPFAAMTEPHSIRGSRVWTGPRDALVSLLEARPDVWVQDAASARCVAALDSMVATVGKGLIVDLCAGRGTKTRQLAAMFPEATILATDTDAVRLEALARACASLPNVRVKPMPEAMQEGRGAQLVLLDVPCSNSGVLARRIEARYRLTDELRARLVETQREILRAGASLLAPTGRIVYSTCSIDPAENDAQAQWASELGLAPAAPGRLTLPAGLPGEPSGTYHDGSYSVCLERR